MIADQAIVYPAPVIAEIRSHGSRCQVRYRMTDRDDGDPITVTCRSRALTVLKTLHIPTVTQLSACHVVVATNEVRFPQLVSVNNCQRSLKISNYGQEWINSVRGRNRVRAYPVDRVMFERVKKRPGCYAVTVLFDRFPDLSSRALDERSGSFCLPMAK